MRWITKHGEKFLTYRRQIFGKLNVEFHESRAWFSGLLQRSYRVFANGTAASDFERRSRATMSNIQAFSFLVPVANVGNLKTEPSVNFQPEIYDTHFHVTSNVVKWRCLHEINLHHAQRAMLRRTRDWKLQLAFRLLKQIRKQVVIT